MMWVLALYGCAAGVAGGSGQGGRDIDGRTYQEAREDNLLAAAVTTALVRDRSLPSLDIEVQTRDGVVTLQGRVASREVAPRAVAGARGVPGVKEVRDELRVAP
ncbi:MAG TPA: BON domain-containing protein [Gammaproteobacteria bacterium]